MALSLCPSLRAFIGLRLGQNFSCVRVHNDPGKVESEGETGARAYKVGRDMVFGKGHYAPETPAGH